MAIGILVVPDERLFLNLAIFGLNHSVNTPITWQEISTGSDSGQEILSVFLKAYLKGLFIIYNQIQ
jgi:hypothetical protein